jgi:EAL domain-containing protein (putative c-di-GMP-specific phosphodiesterase class I)
MGLGCIVAGVETEAELEPLRAFGCADMQGYRFSRPLTEQAALEFVVKRKSREADRAIA